jgi:predicted DNA-binding transcriptional regulator AlpA
VIDVDQLAEQIARKVAVRADPDALWALEDVAAYAAVSVRRARDYAAQPSFPRAVRVGGGHPRYIRREVVQWFERQREAR